MLNSKLPRRVVPRWRASWVTARTAEASVKKPTRRMEADTELLSRQRELTLRPSVPVAAELMFLAEQTNNIEIARDAAAVIIENESAIGATSLIRVAKRIMSGGEQERSYPNDFIREARKVLSLDFRNPVLLMDVARELTVNRHEQAAKKYVQTAVGLAPNSRFVLRSAARFYLHIGDLDRAHQILSSSPLLKTDPWIQASEVAISTVRGKTSLLAKQIIRNMLSIDVSKWQNTELASAVATVELLSGTEKKAKKLFQKSLLNPNDNTVAQAEWAASRLNLVVDEVALKTPFSFEANSNNAYRRLQIHEAIACATLWAEDEPFSTRPFGTLAYLFSLNEEFTEAKGAARTALQVAGKDDISLRLNLLFALIEAGDYEEARAEMIRLSQIPDAKRYRTHLLANAGAFSYATGDAVHGRELYRRAISSARSNGNPSEEALAQAYLVRAAIKNGDEDAATLLESTVAIVEQLPSSGAIYVVQSLLDPHKKERLQKIADNRIAKKIWTWDTATNTLRHLE